ncbi:hypothetical protein NQ314_007210 [Rhamnusium bicolor]|uniref:Pre-mRNA-splicing factor SPF27 n=1 Tax=Rhamnusium bicolor TaxID=1586634 RepID=A0AAV8YPZ1_9CUCU|nr:hypothetical protein NQ314_007210 [Rhamnusium bicolor]
MAGEVVVDALPYIDQGYDEPGVREAAFAMVEEECRRYRPTKNYLEHFPPLNNRLPMETLSMKRYELPPPPSGKLNEVGAWTECVDNSQAQLEHQAVRILNLQLMLEYCFGELRQQLQEVNWQRKSLQTKGGEQLRALEAKWVSLVSQNYEIEQACCMAEEYITQVKQNPQPLNY